MYLKYNEPEQTIDNIFATFIKLLAQESDSMPPALVELYEYHQDRNTSSTVDEMLDTLSSIFENYTKVYCVIDALDECSEELRWDLLEKLDHFQPKLHLLITSRFLDSIAEELSSFERFEIKANKADIELFIDNQIRKNRNLRKHVEKSSTLRGDIKTSVVRTAEDM